MSRYVELKECNASFLGSESVFYDDFLVAQQIKEVFFPYSSLFLARRPG